jgi:hypothetical protein
VSYLKHACDWAYGVDLGNGGSAQQWSAQERAAIQKLSQQEVQAAINKIWSERINNAPEPVSWGERKRPGGLTANQIEWCRANIPAFMPKVLP